jgi:hypothetical protein
VIHRRRWYRWRLDALLRDDYIVFFFLNLFARIFDVAAMR